MKGRDALSAGEGADCVAKFGKQIPALEGMGISWDNELRERKVRGFTEE